MVQGVCSNCGASFYLNLETIKEYAQEHNQKLNEGVEVWCPHCNAVHLLRLEDK